MQNLKEQICREVYTEVWYEVRNEVGHEVGHEVWNDELEWEVYEVWNKVRNGE